MCNIQFYLDSLDSAFPVFRVSGEIARHDCEECASIRGILKDKNWKELDSEFLRESYDALPLLTSEAFHAFVPAWLSYSLENPHDEVSEFLLIHLSDMPKTKLFTKQQARIILEIVDFPFKEMPDFYLDEETLLEQHKIHHMWQSIAA